MNAHRVDILHITYGNAVAVAVSDHFIFNFFPTADIAFNKDLTDTAQSQTIAGNIMQLLCIMCNTAAAAAQCISWSDNNRITVLLCKIKTLIEGGDRLTINSAGSFARNYTVEGNEESSLLREFNLAYVEGAEKLNDIAAAYARNGQSEEELKRLAKAYSDEYLRIKRAQLAFIVEHKASIAAVYALSQRLPGDRYLFNGQGDAVYYRTVADALEERYPQSPYLASLHAEISRLDALQNLSATVSEAGFPDLEIADMYGKKVRLSSLEGNVVLIDFWSPSLGNSNALNADLKQLYEKYHDSGFEVYQVAVETSKPMWINTVQEQSLPWISVCDLRGEASPALTIYNVRKLPANYLIDRKGDIVAKDLYGTSLEQQLEKLL